MIFYFSGTGNSLYVAKNIALNNNETLISIADIVNSKEGCYEYTLKEDEIIGFVYPIYSWAPPKMVIDFIKKFKLNNYKDNYVFTVATCGKNIGNTITLIENCLNKKNILLKSGFSIAMPNNFMTIGNVDSKEVENKKLVETEDKLKKINTVIKERKKGVYEVDKGFLPGLLTSVFNPIFNKYVNNTSKFYANDNCTSCGLCESVCNTQTIKVKEKPTWGDKCTKCFACINLCPSKAIQIGKGTESKGRYKNPNINAEELKIKK